ncbi:MAG: flavin reductase family protein [Caldicoprobacterales bacterium]|jgi:flavin reductase (DIM6/NTAB) family NADH-FMN oxidoreductase RutF|nr:flavin reductase family protein [Clostridiales bacterium]
MKKEVPISKAYHLINTGCVLLITSAHEDKKNVMTLAWQTPVSVKPVLVGIAVSKSHFTTQLIKGSREFTINIPGAELLEKVKKCGMFSGREVDKFREANLTPVSGKNVKVPLIDECIGHIECKVVNEHITGDHVFFVGEVIAAYAREDLFISTSWAEDASLLHHLGGKTYYTNGKIYTT